MHSFLDNEVYDRDRHPRQQQRCDLAGHQRDRQSLENWIEQNDKRTDDDSRRGQHHGAEPDRPGVDDRLNQRDPVT